MPGIQEYSLSSGALDTVKPMDDRGRSVTPPPSGPLSDQDRDLLERYLQTPAGGSTPPRLARTIAGNVARSPQGSAYLPLLHKAKAQIAASQQTNEPDVGVLGRTVTSMQQKLGMAPEIAAVITRKLYAPALNHPAMQDTVRRVQHSVGQLAQAGVGPFVDLAAQTAATTPPPPPLKITPEDQQRINAIRVLLGQPAKPAPKADPIDQMSDSEAREFADGLGSDADDADDGIGGTVKQGIGAIYDAARGE